MIYTEHEAAIKAHARHSATAGPTPHESCGAILMCEDCTTEYRSMSNVARFPADEFEFNPATWNEIRNRALCIIHSHHGDEQPGHLTPSDIESARALGLPIAVYHADFDVWDYWDPDCWHPWPLQLEANPIPAITVSSFVGWPFEYGRADCWSLARGWYQAMCSLTLPDYPRGDVEQLEGFEFNPFGESYAEFGFEAIADHSDIRDHDLLIFRMGSKGEATHCAVVVDAANGLGLHHLGQTLLSSTFQIERWKSRLETVLRHPNANRT